MKRLLSRLGLAAALAALLTVLLRALSRRRSTVCPAAGFRVLGVEGFRWTFTMNLERPTSARETITGGELLERCRTRGPLLSESELDQLLENDRSGRPPEDKWQAL